MVQVFTDVPPTHVYMCVCWLCYERVVESGCIWVEVFFVRKTYGCSMSVFFLYTFKPGVQLSSMKW